MKVKTRLGWFDTKTIKKIFHHGSDRAKVKLFLSSVRDNTIPPQVLLMYAHAAESEMINNVDN